MDTEEIPFELAALVGRAELPMSAYMALQAGDIVLLDQSVGESFSLKVGEEVRYRGRLGLCETRKAVKIDERIHP